MENSARRMGPNIAFFSIRISLFPTFATVETVHQGSSLGCLLNPNAQKRGLVSREKKTFKGVMTLLGLVY